MTTDELSGEMFACLFRLFIRHNEVKKYFDDYKDFYPAGLSFQLAIHVFWRPKHLAKGNDDHSRRFLMFC